MTEPICPEAVTALIRDSLVLALTAYHICPYEVDEDLFIFIKTMWYGFSVAYWPSNVVREKDTDLGGDDHGDGDSDSYSSSSDAETIPDTGAPMVDLSVEKAGFVLPPSSVVFDVQQIAAHLNNPSDWNNDTNTLASSYFVCEHEEISSRVFNPIIRGYKHGACRGGFVPRIPLVVAPNSVQALTVCLDGLLAKLSILINLL